MYDEVRQIRPRSVTLLHSVSALDQSSPAQLIPLSGCFFGSRHRLAAQASNLGKLGIDPVQSTAGRLRRAYDAVETPSATISTTQHRNTTQEETPLKRLDGLSLRWSVPKYIYS